MIIWITGLPGSGKTTLANEIKDILEEKTSNNIVILDGDNIRNILPYEISYSNEDRKKLAFFYSKLALLIEKSNCIVICSFVALFHCVQEHTRLNANDYFEIFLDPSLEELVTINKKDLYSDGSDYMLKQITKHEFPKNPELRLRNIVDGIYQDYLSEIYFRNNIDSVSKKDDTSFSTSLGRTVYGGGGITPDSIVSNVDEDFSQVLIHLYTSDFFDNLIFDFVDINRQSLSQTSSSNIFRITNQQKSSLLSEIDQWIINEGASNPSWLFNIDTFALSHAAIIKRIQALVIRQHWGWSEMQKFLNQSDKVVLTSLSLL